MNVIYYINYNVFHPKKLLRSSQIVFLLFYSQITCVEFNRRRKKPTRAEVQTFKFYQISNIQILPNVHVLV
jgi:hypothetical protein